MQQLVVLFQVRMVVNVVMDLCIQFIELLLQEGYAFFYRTLYLCNSGCGLYFLKPVVFTLQIAR